MTSRAGAPILWPLCKCGRGSHSLVVYKDLLKALRRKSNQALAHWWNVAVVTVSKWCRLLSIPRATEGASRLHSDYEKEPWAGAARAKAHSKNRDPERCRKIAEARRGKPRPPHVIQAVRQAHPGKHPSEESRRKMSEAQKRRWQSVTNESRWTPEQDERVRTLPIAEAMRRTGRTRFAILSRRHRLGVPDGRRRG